MHRAVSFAAILALSACFSGSSSNPSRNVPDGYGAVCGSSALIGKPIGQVGQGDRGACGFSNAVDLFSVAGVELNGDARLNCPTARALETWVSKSVIPAVRSRIDEALVSMDSWSSYRCSNRGGGRLSEHAKGNAIDIAGFRTTAGTHISVLRDWGEESRRGRALDRIVRGACGPFGVVLHPGNDAAHRDHLHLDISNRSGAYVFCRENP